MEARKAFRTFLTYLLPTLVLLLVMPFQGVKHTHKPHEAFRDGPLVCAIALGDFDIISKGYLTGFNYEMLERFGEVYCDSTEIFLGERSVSYADSLLRDSLDILVIPSCDVPDSGRFTIVHPFDTTVAWVLKYDPYKGHEIIRWSNYMKESKGYRAITSRFFEGYNPYRKGPKNPSVISPYDALVKKNAKVVSWDWKLLAALMWNESMFRIQARSPKGALGLMQMMPVTAGRYGVEDMLNPEENIEAAAKYLLRLQRIFSTYTDDPDVLTSLTIAAYNCGEGRALEDLEGREQSSETAAYVKGVLNLYDFFCGKEPRFRDAIDTVAMTAPADTTFLLTRDTLETTL
ncbi:MAG: transglycosylase SLT domain-containing protein [Bacteroidales bacterium]|nr:transglycosylase SLT domain-containing protein [Bacteroidales bacterium]